MVPTTGAIIAGVLACVLLIFSGYASGSEIAFFSLSPNDLNDLNETKETRGKSETNEYKVFNDLHEMLLLYIKHIHLLLQ